MNNVLAPFAVVNTKSNFRNLNGKPLQVVDILGSRVSCRIFAEDLGTYVTADFHKDEVNFMFQPISSKTCLMDAVRVLDSPN